MCCLPAFQNKIPLPLKVKGGGGIVITSYELALIRFIRAMFTVVTL
jgi:hypothetical protein